MNFVITKIFERSLMDKDLLDRHDLYKTKDHRYRFRLYDDDKNIYYEGLGRVNNSFDPIDEFGYAAGCTEIHYLENGKFVRL